MLRSLPTDEAGIREVLTARTPDLKTNNYTEAVLTSYGHEIPTGSTNDRDQVVWKVRDWVLEKTNADTNLHEVDFVTHYDLRIPVISLGSEVNVYVSGQGTMNKCRVSSSSVPVIWRIGKHTTFRSMKYPGLPDRE